MSQNGQLSDRNHDLFSASSLGNYGAVEDILKSPVLCDVNGVNDSGWTALMYSSNYGHFNVVKLLVKYKCDVDYRDSWGRTALMLAACNGHTRCIDALINYGKANRYLKDFSGIDALGYASNNGHGNNKLIKNLLNGNTTSASEGYELRGRTFSVNAAPFIPSMSLSSSQSSDSSTNSDETNHIYNPCELNAFSNTLSSLPTGNNNPRRTRNMHYSPAQMDILIQKMRELEDRVISLEALQRN